MANGCHWHCQCVIRVRQKALAQPVATRLYFVVLISLLVGCSNEPPELPEKSPSTGAAVPSSVALRVLVVNEPELAEAIGRLRGEWEERFGGELSTESKPWSGIVAGRAIDADLIVFPTRYLGELCSRGWLRPVRNHVLESEALDWDDVFPLVRRELVTWGGAVMALPLGVDDLTFRPLNDRDRTIQFLTFAAPIATSNQRLGTLFEVDTMRPRIAEAEFVDAIRRVSAVESVTGTESIRELEIPLMGFGDRLAAVTTSSPNAASAFKLLEWLATSEISSQLASVGQAAAPVRRSLESSSLWYASRRNPSERKQAGERLSKLLSGPSCFIIPRIPGIDEYLAALNTAVVDVAAGREEPKAALESTARQWERITERLGRDQQREAYLKHLNLSQP